MVVESSLFFVFFYNENNLLNREEMSRELCVIKCGIQHPFHDTEFDQC